MWTVYKHTAPNGKVYIGITGNKVKNRWRNGHGYETQIFYRAIKKYGWENINHEILFEGLTKKQAGEMEQHLIEKYDCIVPKGYNKSKGGEIPWNAGKKGLYKHTKETINKMKGKTPWNKGKKVILSNEGRENIVNANKGRTPWNKGKHGVYSKETINKIIESGKKRKGEKRKKLTLEQRKKLSESHKGLPSNRKKKVLCIELNKTFDSLEDARKHLGLKSSGHISQCCYGKRKTAGGYHWKYVEEQS